MKQIIIDTDTLSYYLKNNPIVVKNYKKHIDKFGFLYISRITVYEALSGLKYKKAEKQLAIFREFLQMHQILELNEKSVEISSSIYAELRKKGKINGQADIFIAGISIANKLILATNNIKHYENIANIKLTNWTVE